jgi:hypothetical protein
MFFCLLSGFALGSRVFDATPRQTSSSFAVDTPAQKFFANSRRDFSHGCIRLEKPADLAVWVLRDNPGWNMDRVLAAMNGTRIGKRILPIQYRF